MNSRHGLNQGRQVHGFCIAIQLEEKLLRIDNADNVVLALVNYREAGILFLSNDFKIFLIRFIQIKADHIGPGNHNLFGQHLVKSKDSAYITKFCLIDLAALEAFIDNDLKLFFGVSIFMLGSRLDAEQFDQLVRRAV